MSLVLDSSVTIAYLYQGETTEAVNEIFVSVRNGGAWVPSLWSLEVANVLQMGVRRGRHDAAFRDASLADLELVPIRVDSSTPLYAWGKILHLADSYDLTIYDATYLELAMRLALPLATLDQALRIAAARAGVELLGI